MPRGKIQKNDEALSVFYGGVLHNVEVQLDIDHAIENKINALFAASLVVSVFLAERLNNYSLLNCMGIAFLLLSALIALYSTRIKGYFTGAVSLEEHYEYTKLKNRDFLLQMMSDAETAFNEIKKRSDRKANAYTGILLSFTIGTTLSLISLLIR